MARVTRMEIESATEMFVNSIYDNGDESGWVEATLEQWIDAVYKELVTWKTDNRGTYWHSNENRFEGREDLVKKIKPYVVQRLKELKKEGYAIKAL